MRYEIILCHKFAGSRSLNDLKLDEDKTNLEKEEISKLIKTFGTMLGSSYQQRVTSWLSLYGYYSENYLWLDSVNLPSSLLSLSLYIYIYIYFFFY